MARHREPFQGQEVVEKIQVHGGQVADMRQTGQTASLVRRFLLSRPPPEVGHSGPAPTSLPAAAADLRELSFVAPEEKHLRREGHGLRVVPLVLADGCCQVEVPALLGWQEICAGGDGGKPSALKGGSSTAWDVHAGGGWAQ